MYRTDKQIASRLTKSIVMTYYGKMKTTNISYFKSHLSQELRAVRNGERIIILDRDIPVAEVLPYDINKKNIRIQLPTKKLQYSEPSFKTVKDPLFYLLEDRARG